MPPQNETSRKLIENRMVMIKETVVQPGTGQCHAGDDKDFGIPESLLLLGSLTADG
jgi:hypothetical protein